MKIRHLNIRPPRVEMLPLIDIVFLLLVVFIYTMLSMAVHQGMPVALPTGEQVQPEKEAPHIGYRDPGGRHLCEQNPRGFGRSEGCSEKLP